MSSANHSPVQLHSSENKAPASWSRDVLGIVLLFGLIMALGLGSYPLGNPDEGRYAEIPREMITTGDYVTPRLNGVNYFEKPPLIYWCVAGCYQLFGPHEWAMRLPPVLFALGGVLAAYATGRKLYGHVAGRAAAAVLGTSLLYVALARILLLDMAVAVLISATLFFFILAVQEPPGQRRRWMFYGLYACAALATLTKGLIGVLLPGAVMFLWLLLCGQWKRLLPFYLPSGALLFLAIAAPWHLLAASRNPTWAHFYFVREHWERFTTTEHGRFEPWWYFIPIILVGLFPWTELGWHALRDELKRGWSKRRENAEFWFFFIWAVFIFLFFSKSQSKLIPYILPVFPPLAVVIGKWLAWRFSPDGAAAKHPRFRIFSVVAGLLAVGLVVGLMKPEWVDMRASQFAGLRPFACVLAAIFAASAGIIPWLAKQKGPHIAVRGLVVAMFFVLATFVLAARHLQKPGTKELAEIVTARAEPTDKIYHYLGFFHDFTFYSERLVGLVDYRDELEPENDPEAAKSGRFIDKAELLRQWESPDRIWLVLQKKHLPFLTADTAFHYQLIGETEKHYLLSNHP